MHADAVIVETIFEPFVRESTHGSVPGTGLGLAAVHEFTRVHGGSVSVEDRPDGGTRLRVHVPAAPTPRADR
ncbi:MAG TPA: ATP-binding protein [Nitriliruptorales bacterium]|nr:ATP-binding protein [Nitriliruptorales bacterium]